MQATASAQAVCVDHRQVATPPGTGVARYADGLRRGVADAGWRMVPLTDLPAHGRAWRWAAVLSPGSTPLAECDGALNAPDVFRRAQVRFDLRPDVLTLRAASPPALMHWSHPVPLRLSGVPNLYTIHDLIPWLRPELTPMSRRRHRRLLDALRARAAHLVTVSECSRRDIIEAFDWPPELVTNTYQPVDPAPGRDDAPAAFGLTPGGYFLHVGTIETRKNVARLIQAHRLSRSARPLVLAGPDGWGARGELADAAGVTRLGWVERDALLGLMRQAAAVLAPSLAEGFGLPAAEAMALGTPVLTSHDGASAEIAGGAALLADPLDTRAIAAGIAALDGDADLRARLSAAGRARARMFSRQAYAARLASLYAAMSR